MKNIFYTFLILITISCKKKPEEKGNTEIIAELPVEKEIIRPKTIIEYIEFGNKSNAEEVNDTIGEYIPVKAVSLFKEQDSKKVFIAIKLEGKLEKGLYGNYRIIALMWPYDKNQVRPENAERNLEFDSWYLDLKTHSDGQNTYIWGQVSDELENFKKVMLRQINLKTGKLSEKQITIENGLSI